MSRALFVFLGALITVAARSSGPVPTTAERSLVAFGTGSTTYVGVGDAGAASLRVFRDMKFELTFVVAPGKAWVAKGDCTASATSGSDFNLVVREIAGDMPRPMPATGVIGCVNFGRASLSLNGVATELGRIYR